MSKEYPYQNLSLSNLPNEEWRNVVGYDGLYMVSNFGRMKSLERFSDLCIRENKKPFSYKVKERILKQHCLRGYLYVHLCKNNSKKMERVHRIVATAFIENPDGYKIINHKNEDKMDNFVGNIEWCNQKYNANYGTRNERVSKTQRHHRKDAKPVILMTIDGIPIKEYTSITDAGRDGWDRKAISNICRNTGLSKTTKGYIWKFKN